MTELVIYRGLPASGKTTQAREWVAEDPTNRARVNRDDLRLMLHDGYHGHEAEQQVTVARDRLIEALLRKGVSVASDDTNLRTKYAREIAQIGVRAGATVRVVDLTDVPLEECIARDFNRGYPELAEGFGGYDRLDAIRKMHERFLAGRDLPFPSILDDPAPPPNVYVAKPGTPKAVLIDLDGTLCLHDGRSPYDETLVHTDLPNLPVVAAVRAFARAGYRIIFCSGRSEGCRAETTAWIRGRVGPFGLFGESFGGLLMRAEGDKRRDSVVKRELFDQHVRDHYDVECVLDDRQQVVDMWRSIGLTVFQVAEGQF